MFTVAKAVEGQLLRAWREARGLSQADTAGRLDRPMEGSEIGRYERGRSSPSVKTLLNLISGLDVPGKTDEERLAAFFRGPELAAVPLAPGPTRAVPLVDEPVAAGPPLSASEARESLEVPVDLLKRLLGHEPSADPRRYCLVEVEGDSMAPRIANGALLLVDRGEASAGWDAHQIQNGATYVCVPPGDDGGTTKRVFLTKDHLILWPDNEAYSPVQVPLEQLKHEDRWVSHVVRGLVVTIMNPATPAQPAARPGKRRK